MFDGIPNLHVLEGAPLSEYTRFGIGGPADTLVETASPASFGAALARIREARVPWVVIGGGTNLIVSDQGYRGVAIRFSGNSLRADGELVIAESGAVLQDLVDFTTARGLRGLETLAGIPGWVGAAVYGNAGAYGHSISERVQCVRFHDGEAILDIPKAECDFRYRESVFKRRKDWIILSTTLRLESASAAELQAAAAEILEVRNVKFPPAMKCAGSIFKNFLLAELPAEVAGRVPPAVVREGKVAAAYFLEQVGAKGLSLGGIRVAEYHANLVYNAGGGTAAELCALISELKRRVHARFGIEVEEEVQYVGFGTP